MHATMLTAVRGSTGGMLQSRLMRGSSLPMASRVHDDQIDLVIGEVSWKVVPFGSGREGFRFAGLGVEKQPHCIELTKVKSENIQVLSFLRVLGLNGCNSDCLRNSSFRVRVARCDLKGSHPKPRT